MVIEEKFLKILYEEKIIEKQYKTFSSHTDLDKSFDILISIGGDGTILRAATFVRASGIHIVTGKQDFSYNVGNVENDDYDNVVA